MKKIPAILLVTMLIFSMNISAFAATKQDVLNTVYSFEGINGRETPIPDKYVKMLADFLNSDNYTAAELDSMVAALNGAGSTIRSSGAAYWNELSDSQKSSLQGAASSAGSAVGARVSFDGTALTVVSRTGKVFNATVSAGGGYSVYDPSSNSVDNKSTGTTGTGTTGSVPSSTRTITYSGDTVIKTTGIGMDFTNMYLVFGTALAFMAVAGFGLKKRNLSKGC